MRIYRPQDGTVYVEQKLFSQLGKQDEIKFILTRYKPTWCYIPHPGISIVQLVYYVITIEEASTYCCVTLIKDKNFCFRNAYTKVFILFSLFYNVITIVEAFTYCCVTFIEDKNFCFRNAYYDMPYGSISIQGSWLFL